MGFSLPFLHRRLPVAGLAVALACSVNTRAAGHKPGEAILFSLPDDTAVSSNVPSLAARPPMVMDFANPSQLPGSGMDASSQEPPPPLPPAVSPGLSPQAQRQLEERENWGLLTPAQILGLSTPEKILGIASQDEDESVVQQFLERQNQMRANTNHANYAAADTFSSPSGGVVGNRQMSPFASLWTPANGGLGNPALTNLSPFSGGTAGSQNPPAVAAEPGWLKAFSQPGLPDASSPNPPAAVNQFDQSSQFRPFAGGTDGVSALGSPISSSLFATPGLAPATFGETAAGALSSGTVLPTGLPALPGLPSATNIIRPAPAREWTPPPPPWMSSAPQLGVAPQRNF